jgi:hypothetical protein
MKCKFHIHHTLFITFSTCYVHVFAKKYKFYSSTMAAGLHLGLEAWENANK